MRGDEDDPAAVVARGLQILERDRVDLHQVVQLGFAYRRESHYLGEVLAEVSEGASRDARHLWVFRRPPQHDREVAFGDLAPAPPGEIRELAAHDGSKVDEALGKPLDQRRRATPRPVEEAVMEGDL